MTGSLAECRHGEFSNTTGWSISNRECDIFLYDTDHPDRPVYAYIRYRANAGSVSREERTNEDSGQLAVRTESECAQREDSVARSTRRASDVEKETISQVSCDVVRPIVLFAALVLIALTAIRIKS